MRLLSLCATLSLLAGVPAVDAYAADARPPRPEMKPKVPEYSLQAQSFVFPTGLRIVMQSDRSHPVVTTWMIVNHGSKDDPKGKEETAHFVEHTWFRSKHGDLPPIMDTIQDLGTMFNATTRNDWTDYRTVASSEYLPIMLKLESLRLTEPYQGVTEEEIDVEREVIRNEWRRRNEQSNALFVDYLYKSVYPEEHGYHDHSTHETIDNIKLADLQGFFDDYYTPENTTIFVVGDFDPEQATTLIFENFDPKVLHPDLTSRSRTRTTRPTG
jgi:zinc protease